jgi:hypothetical protein
MNYQAFTNASLTMMHHGIRVLRAGIRAGELLAGEPESPAQLVEPFWPKRIVGRPTRFRGVLPCTFTHIGTKAAPDTST